MKNDNTSFQYNTTTFPPNNNTSKGKSSLSNLNFDLQYFVNLDSENKICFDCGGPFPTYVSINNGVFICSNCANNHSRLGYNISFIHQITSPWDKYILSYALRGGNSRFKRLCNQYEVPCQSYNENDDEKLNKYIIRLGEYHRLLLRSEILADEPPKPLYFEVAKDKCDLNVIYFPEFENYHLYNGDIIVPQGQNSVGEKIWNGTKTTVGVVGKAGKVFYNVGKPVVCFLGKSAFNGIKYLGKSIYSHYYPENDKIKNSNNKFNGKITNDNDFGNSSGNDFKLVDYCDEDLKQTKTLNINGFTDNGNINFNNNINYNNNNHNYAQNNFNNNYNGNYNNNMNINGINTNKYNTYTIDDNYSNNNIINNNIINNQFENNNNNNIISNKNYYMNNSGKNIYNYNQDNINNFSYDTLQNENVNKSNYKIDDFEILSKDDENTNSNNSLFDNNLYAGSNVIFENTDQKKARQDANNFLLKP